MKHMEPKETSRRSSLCLAMALYLGSCLAGATNAEESTPLVKHLLELANKSKGVCLVRCGGELALDLTSPDYSS